MGRTARTVLSRMSPLSWATAIALTILRLVHPLWAPGIDDLIVVLTGLGLAGILTDAVQATHDHDIAALGRALATATQDGTDQMAHRARGVLSPACPRPGRRPAGSPRRSAPLAARAERAG